MPKAFQSEKILMDPERTLWDRGTKSMEAGPRERIDSRKLLFVHRAVVGS